MKARAFLIGFVVILFWMAPNPNQSQARMAQRGVNKVATSMAIAAPTTQPDQAK